MKNFTTRLQRDITTNHPIFLTNRSKLLVFVKICKKSLGTDRLQKGDLGGSIESTISFNADRKRYLSGIFLPAISQRYGITTPEVYSELAVRATRRTKTGNRTNNADCLKAVVEPLPHPIEAVSFNHKLTRTFKMLFKFLLLGEKRLTVRVRAKSEAEARQRIQLTSPAICIARFSDNLTACKHSPMGEVSEIVHSPMVDGHAYSTSTNGVSNTEQKTILHPLALIGYSAPVVAKSTAERGNSNNLLVANNSTPLTRAFFVRGIRTPKENALSVLLSMVGRNGQRLIVGCFPLVAVFHPVTLYRQAWKLAVDSQKSTSGVTPMIYLLKCVNRYAHAYQENVVKVQAPSADEARWQLSAQYRLLHVVAQFPDRLSAHAEQKFAKLSQNLTACSVRTEQNHSLPKVGQGCSIGGTTTLDADRKRYPSGIFLPTIPQNHGITTPEIYSELAVRATRRTKPSNRTNNADCSKAVVEPLPRLLQAVSFNHKLTRTLEMLFKFLFTGSRLRIAVHAKTLAEAYTRLPIPQPNSRAILIARLPSQAQGGVYA